MLLSTVDIGKALLNTVMGMGTVFVVLVFISWIIGLFRYLNKPERQEVKPEPIPVVDNVVAQDEEEELSDDAELVAVITAAIAAYEGESTAGASNSGFRVRSIKRARR